MGRAIIPCRHTMNMRSWDRPNRKKVAKNLRFEINHDVIIIDANDLGVAVLGKSNEDISDAFCKNVFKDNPLGQSLEHTPLCIVRKIL